MSDQATLADAAEPDSGETVDTGRDAVAVVRSERPMEISLEAEEMNLLWNLARRVSETDFVPKPYRGRPEQTFAAIIQGRALGVDAMTALREIWISPNGSPEMSAELQAGLVRRAGHIIEGFSTRLRAEVTGKRVDTGEEMKVTFTLDDAVEQGLVELKDGKPYARSKDDKPMPWERFTEAMLWHRATTTLVRRLFPDVLIGASL